MYISDNLDNFLYKEAIKIIKEIKGEPSVTYIERRMGISHETAEELYIKMKNDRDLYNYDATEIDDEKFDLKRTKDTFLTHIMKIFYFTILLFLSLFVILFFILFISNNESIEVCLGVSMILIGLSLYIYSKYETKKIMLSALKSYNKKDNDLYQLVIFKLIKGKTIQEIAFELSLNVNQIKKFMKRMEYEKLGNFTDDKHLTITNADIYNNKYLKIEIADNTIRENKRKTNIFEKHKNTLIKKYKQLIYKNDYGELCKDKFRKELEYFITNILYKNKELSETEIETEIDNILDIVEEQIENSTNIELSDNPYDFEKQCAEILKKNGWDAEATQKSADQGIDVVAKKDGVLVALQCKLYSKPVGNKAVQEAYSGKQFYEADYAGVVSNNTYTVSARQLAKNCNILLLSPEDLPNLESLIK